MNIMKIKHKQIKQLKNYLLLLIINKRMIYQIITSKSKNIKKILINKIELFKS